MTASPKTALRACARAARSAMSPDERRAASARIVARLERLPELRGATIVVLYAATADEADLSAFAPTLHRRGARTLFPRVRGDALELVGVEDLHGLVLGYRGIAEPAGPAIDPDVVDAVLLPGLAFDPAGGRLGQGGGHYDRLLARLPGDALRVGVAFACQMVPRVPREPHDLAVDIVVTDRVTHRVARPSPGDASV